MWTFFGLIRVTYDKRVLHADRVLNQNVSGMQKCKKIMVKEMNKKENMIFNDEIKELNIETNSPIKL